MEIAFGHCGGLGCSSLGLGSGTSLLAGKSSGLGISCRRNTGILGRRGISGLKHLLLSSLGCSVVRSGNLLVLLHFSALDSSLR